MGVYEHASFGRRFSLRIVPPFALIILASTDVNKDICTLEINASEGLVGDPFIGKRQVGLVVKHENFR